jgi:lipopolysaccharide assembly outer membrane protein LptD (OstA)
MKRLILLVGISVLALAQQVIPPDDVQITSDSQQRDGSIHRLSGHVVIKTSAVTIRTEKADYNIDTNAITTHGETTIELK